MMNNIFYLGPEGSFSHIIAQKISKTNTAVACRSFAEIVKKTLSDTNSIGILPIENSITSNVHENMDYLFEENLGVIGEAYLRIQMHLIGFEGTEIGDIQKVYSHPQALAQCKGYIEKHHFEVEETSSTAAAKSLILKLNDKHAAAIGNDDATRDEGLKIIDRNIADAKFNITRFLIITANETREQTANNNKASIVFSLDHKPGTLAKLLTGLGGANFNLAKIESRPIPSTDWEYRFWVDIENKSQESISEKALSDILDKYTKSHKLIGIYPSGIVYE